MKVPKARKLKSGNWFIQLRLDGESVPVTAPTEKECTRIATLVKAEHMAGKRIVVRSGDKTLTQAIDDFISARENTLSPSTIRGYRIIQRNRFKELMSMKLKDITGTVFQKAIDLESKSLSPKTIKNSVGFICTVIYQETDIKLKVSTPQIVPNEHPFLEPEQIPIFLKAIHGTKIELPCLLGLWSLRASEIYALTYDKFDFDKKLIRIEGAVVPNEHNELVTKNTNKNDTSRRAVPLADRVGELVKQAPDKNKLIPISRQNLYAAINKLCKENNLPLIGVHGLRHSFVSFGFYLDMPKDIIREIGGWSNDGTMEKIYKHLSQSYRLTHQNTMLERFNLLTKSLTNL